MKKHIFLTLTLLLFTRLVYAQTPTANLQNSATAQPTVKATTQGSTKSTISDKIQNFDKTATAIVTFVAKYLVIALITLLLCRVIWLLSKRSYQLVIDKVDNAFDHQKFNEKDLEGFSQLLRENLVREIQQLHQQLKFISSIDEVEDNDSEQLIKKLIIFKAPLSEEAKTQADQKLDNLITTLSSFTSDYIEQFMKLINIVFPPLGTRVTSILQNEGGENSKLGITFEITDIKTQRPLKLYTVWECIGSKNKTNDLCEKALKERYIKLIKIAAQWLSIEISRQEMLKEIPKKYSGSSNNYKAEINNFFGVLNYHSASTDNNFFYDLAIEDLQEAINQAPEFYRPHENISNVYITKGQEEPDSKNCINLQYQAILQAQEALDCLTKENEQHKSEINQICNEYNNSKKKNLENIIEENDRLKRRIKVSIATAQLLTKEEPMIAAARKEIIEVEDNWHAPSEPDTRLLYNLACWYAYANAIKQNEYNPDYAKNNDKARRYLVYALARNRLLWDWATKDPDIKNIACEGLAQLQIALSKKLHEVRDLPKLPGQKFKHLIEQVMREVNWL